MDDNLDFFDQEITVKLFAENLPCPTYWKNADSVFIGCNSKYLELFGLKSVYGKTDYDMPWCSHAEEEVRQDRIVLNSCQASRFDSDNYICLKSPILISDDKIVGVMGILLDQSEQNDRASFLDQIIASLPGHVYWKNRECILLGCNDEQAKDAGLTSRDEVVGKTAYDLIWQEQQQDEKVRQASYTDSIDREVSAP
ncbi:hypothetical protein [Cysteiniphilum marinum]|uniref:hypothetical protein n=1 Tax=Cysteiniphilum marinum TaxID=2774191 RepID=UPI00193979DF|nr:hypothetical protein [Cysteiniphilum marinum]